MKRLVIVLPVLAMVGMARAQESEKTTVTTTTTTAAGNADLLRELWNVDDATVIETGRTDLRLTFRWMTGSDDYNLGDSDDDFIVSPALVWGPCSNVEVFAEVPVWVGDSGDMGPWGEGNADTNVGFTWRFAEPDGWMPAAALRGTVRIPTGDGSNGVDGEARLILTKEYDSGIRSHVNAFGKTVNTDNDKSVRGRDDDDDYAAVNLGGLGSWWNDGHGTTEFRDFQWGFVFGLDGPLCDNGAVRWVLDYMNRSSVHYGRSNINLLEAGWEWTVSDAQKLGMSVQIGLDDQEDTPNFGAAVTYAHALTY